MAGTGGLILVTGATGFVGRHLLRGLVEAYGADRIVAYTRTAIDGVRCVLHDGYEPESFEFATMGLGGIETIIHAGAGTPKTKAEADDQGVADLNVRVTEHLLKADLPNLKRFVYVSTLDVYAPAEVMSEATPVAPANAYARSKVRGEALVAEWAEITRGVRQVLRLGHVYGPGEEMYRKIIPETMRRLRDGLPVQVFGTGQEQRGFIYVGDVVKALLAALKLEGDIGPVNIAGGQRITMAELVKLLVEISGKQPVVERVESAAGRDMVFDVAKMNRYLLAEELPLRAGLQREWDYMKGRAA